MTLEEKIQQLQASSMEQARAEGNAIIDSHHEALEKVFEEHKVEIIRQSETRIKAEHINARQQFNHTMAQSQTEIKRKYGQIHEELKIQLFQEVRDLISDFMKTDRYDNYLVKCIQHAMQFASGEQITIYINPSDQEKISVLEKSTGATLTISTEDFIGGVRAVIRERNILIDNSFKTALQNEFDKFMFLGGEYLA